MGQWGNEAAPAARARPPSRRRRFGELRRSLGGGEMSESGLRQGYGQARRSSAEAAASAGARASGGGAPRALKHEADVFHGARCGHCDRNAVHDPGRSGRVGAGRLRICAGGCRGHSDWVTSCPNLRSMLAMRLGLCAIACTAAMAVGGQDTRGLDGRVGRAVPESRTFRPTAGRARRLGGRVVQAAHTSFTTISDERRRGYRPQLFELIGKRTATFAILSSSSDSSDADRKLGSRR